LDLPLLKYDGSYGLISQCYIFLDLDAGSSSARHFGMDLPVLRLDLPEQKSLLTTA
jgi:hypothetical protein